MQTNSNSEIGEGTREGGAAERQIESLDDITREISDRRLHAQFGDLVAPEKAQVLETHPDRIEKPEEFKDAARKAGLERTDGVLGWSTDLESPAHVRKGEVPQEIATLVHEDLHRLTHPETLQEVTATPALRDLYEGITEYLTEQAVDGLHEHKPGECYPDEVATAKQLASEVGESDLRAFFFKHELPEEMAAAIERLGLQ